MKGWMQTLAVFVRRPRGQVRKIGAVQSFAALGAMTSLIAGPLFGPFYMVRFVHDLFWGDLLAPTTATRLAFAALNLSVGIYGLAALIAPLILGMKRRGLKASPFLLLAPPLSAAAERRRLARSMGMDAPAFCVDQDRTCRAPDLKRRLGRQEFPRQERRRSRRGRCPRRRAR